MNDSQFPKLETAPDVASTNELASLDPVQARQEKAKHSAFTVATALTAVGALFVKPRLARADYTNGCGWSGCSSGGSGGGGGGSGGTGGGSHIKVTVRTHISTVTVSTSVPAPVSTSVSTSVSTTPPASNPQSCPAPAPSPQPANSSSFHSNSSFSTPSRRSGC